GRHKKGAYRGDISRPGESRHCGAPVRPTRLNYRCQHERNGASGPARRLPATRPGSLTPGTARPAARGGGPATTAVSWPLPAGLTTKRTACRENRDRPDHLVNAGSRTAVSPTDVSQVGDQAASIGGWHAIPYGIP